MHHRTSVPVMVALTLFAGLTGCLRSTPMAPRAAELPTIPAADRPGTQVTLRPISDFLSAQFSTNDLDRQVFWSGNVPNNDFNVWVGNVDYTGRITQYVSSHGGPVLNPVITGTIQERPLPNGTAEVTVNLHFSNVICYASIFLLENVVMGYHWADLVGHPERHPAVASGSMTLMFTNSAPGAPLPDFWDLAFDPRFASAYESVKFHASGFGPLHSNLSVPEGTPGKLTVNQPGMFHLPGRGKGVADGFPADIVNIQPLSD